ncbi:Blue-light-activated protein [Rubripirellula lacrimiformis]|uniref:histidine kinase n=1 Tax=Rubripirellula lacrimiformis TaxID=1930273 RepID=A0A517NIP3_9BACT|nr:response regulator [Rubripirellula lacrimiformis]QDT06958.1 Blue-light-activated protein [Rubripirellula lacrimiformis]
MISNETKPRILIIDDNPSIHLDFRKILVADTESQNLLDAALAFFGDDDAPQDDGGYKLDVELDSAHQGEEGYQKTLAAVEEGRPYTLAFCDMRMPPGWDGLTTIEHLWKADPHLQVVICSAYSDSTWSEITKRLGRSDRLLILKKPFDNAEVMQLAVALIEKRRLISLASLKREELEQRVEERTVQLKERDQALRQKRKLEALGSLAGGIAHEFNNLLQAIMGYTNFAMEDLCQDEQPYDDLSHAMEATSRATAITAELLKFSRQSPPEKSIRQANEIIDTMTVLLKPLLSSRIEMSVEMCDDPGFVSVDLDQLSQALMNLCINARDAMEDGGKLSIQLYRQSSTDKTDCARRPGSLECGPSDFVVIAVTDNGSGMSEDIVERIFEPFYTTKEVGKGTGLGLSMVFGTLEDHGGCVTVESSEGSGSTFRLFLPLVSEPVEDSLCPIASDESAWTGGTETILLAEDDAIVRQITARVLISEGYTVIEAVDGQDAISKINENPDSIQLALLDIIMPHQSGHDVARHLAEVSPETPVIFCTGYDAALNDDAGSELQTSQRLIRKPIYPSTLLQEVRRMLDSHLACLTL